jgi:hypothetical protein
MVTLRYFPLSLLLIHLHRILRALFEYALKKGWTVMVQRILTLCKMVDRRVWGFQHPLRQFATFPVDVLAKLEAKNVRFSP